MLVGVALMRYTYRRKTKTKPKPKQEKTMNPTIRTLNEEHPLELYNACMEGGKYAARLTMDPRNTAPAEEFAADLYTDLLAGSAEVNLEGTPYDTDTTEGAMGAVRYECARLTRNYLNRAKLVTVALPPAEMLTCDRRAGKQQLHESLRPVRLDDVHAVREAASDPFWGLSDREVKHIVRIALAVMTRTEMPGSKDRNRLSARIIDKLIDRSFLLNLIEHAGHALDWEPSRLWRHTADRYKWQDQVT